LLLGSGIFAASVWKAPSSRETPSIVDTVVPSRDSGEQVATITAMVDCRWKRPHGVAQVGGPVCLGGKLDLDSGTLEIAYRTGVDVILQGPATYEVDSEHGGLLLAGRLTAKVEPRDARNHEGTATAAGPRSPNRFAIPPSWSGSPAFVIRCPTALISGAAAEMGLDVGPQACQVHVFQGNVSLRLVRAGQLAPSAIPLAAEQLASVGTVGLKPCAVVTPGAAQRMLFAQRSGRIVLSLPSRHADEFAGAWLKSIGAEEQRRLVAVGSGRDYAPPAGSTAETRGGDFAGPQSPSGAPPSTGGVVYTVRCPFDVPDFAPSTTMVLASFGPLSRVIAARFNGKTVVPRPLDNPKYPGAGCFLSGGLVEKTNLVEIDVSSAVSAITLKDPLLWLHIEISGIRLPGRSAPPLPPFGFHQLR
jgi:hypothetical protein